MTDSVRVTKNYKVTPRGRSTEAQYLREPEEEIEIVKTYAAAVKSSDENATAKPLEVVSFIQPRRGRSPEPEERKVTKENKKPEKIEIPKAVTQQQRRCKKYKYIYKVTNEGNVVNNTTLYLYTELAHQSNVKDLFQRAVAKAKSMPSIFGENFECEVRINLVKRYNGAYLGYAYAHVTNPMLYYALLGMNVDGTERVVYEEPELTEEQRIARAQKKLEQEAMPQFGRQLQASSNWSDYEDEEDVPKKKVQLPPILTLEKYEYDEMQMEFAKRNGKPLIGEVTPLPAFIEPGVAENENETMLYVTDVPAMDYELLYSMFSPYATYNAYSDSDNTKFFFPKINIRQSGEKIFATVRYNNQYDASFALLMNRKVHVLYSGKEVTITTRRAIKKE